MSIMVPVRATLALAIVIAVVAAEAVVVAISAALVVAEAVVAVGKKNGKDGKARETRLPWNCVRWRDHLV